MNLDPLIYSIKSCCLYSATSERWLSPVIPNSLIGLNDNNNLRWTDHTPDGRGICVFWVKRFSKHSQLRVIANITAIWNWYVNYYLCLKNSQENRSVLQKLGSGHPKSELQNLLKKWEKYWEKICNSFDSRRFWHFLLGSYIETGNI